MSLESHADRNCHLWCVWLAVSENSPYIRRMWNRAMECRREKRLTASNAGLLRELKLHASALSRALCYYESNSTTIVVARVVERGVQEYRNGGRLRALVQPWGGCTGTKSEGTAMEYRGARGWHTSVDTGVAALTVKGVLRYEGVREKVREEGKKKERKGDSDGFRISEIRNGRTFEILNV